jgi:hypothetical protein
MDMERRTRVTVDHDEIRGWAEERGGRPAAVKGTGKSGEAGIIRIDFPGYSGAGKLEGIGWEEWFDKFDESNLALIFQEATARGQKSNFNKLVARESVDLKTGNTKARPPRRERRREERQAPSRAGRAGEKRVSRSVSARRASASSSERSGSSKGTKKTSSRGSARRKSPQKKR